MGPGTPEAGDGPRSRRRELLLLLPLAMLSLCWALSNPPGASPDEPDHLVKALGNGALSIGSPGPEPPEGTPPLLLRNYSTTRVFEIPGRLDPNGLTCFAFQPTVTAECQEARPEPPGGDVLRASPVGAYPPFLYVPIGAVARLAGDATSAITAGRLVVSTVALALLAVALAHLGRWVPGTAALGLVASLTPVGLFLLGSLSSSGVELAAACLVASVVAAAAVVPASVHAPATHLAMALGGGLLVLSRQLGILTLAVAVVVLLALLGWGEVRRLLVERRPTFVGAVVVLGALSTISLVWELRYDRPAETASPFDAAALGPFAGRVDNYVASAISTFGWLDTVSPTGVDAAWLVLGGVLVLGAALTARRTVALVVVGVPLLVAVLAFVVYASAFFPIGADLQGRHLLPLLTLPLVLAAASWRAAARRTAVRLHGLVGLLAGAAHLGGLWTNARRYAVGAEGPWWFVGEARWAPPGGWELWLPLYVVSALLLVVVTWGLSPRAARPR